MAQASKVAPKLGAHRSVRLLTALAKLAFLEVDLGELPQLLMANIELLQPKMGAQELGISAWALATLKPRRWRRCLKSLTSQASELELNWWSVAHVEYAARKAGAEVNWPSLTKLCRAELERVTFESRDFRERPLRVAVEMAPWSSCEPCQVLIFGPGRFVRKALQEAGFETSMWRRYASGKCTATEWPLEAKGSFQAASMRYPDSGESFEFALHAVAARLVEGGRLWIYGDVREGVLSTTRAIRGLFSLSSIQEDGDSRVISAIRTRGEAREFEGWLRKEKMDFSFGERDWWSVPGLFAGGGMDVMSQYLLDMLARESWTSGCKVLDFASGNGVLAAGAMSLFGASCWLLDNDAAALAAAARNLPDAVCVLADGFRVDLEDFDLIISNPPVHNGHADDLSLLLELLKKAPFLLRPGGELWLVTQEHIPTGRLFQIACEECGEPHNLQTFFDSLQMFPTQDGRFVVWRARFPARKRKSDVEDIPSKRGKDGRCPP